ncbi:MAG: diguanylate cyclase [Sulfuritalea sp.]|nr:diguanylate cyclase [Sulfuritalea sp.]
MSTAFRSASMDGKLSLRWLPAMLLAVVCFSVGSSWLFDWKQADVTMLAMARERGAALFRLVELTRNWNAHHGGIYVPVTNIALPNPDLDHPRRDLLTRDGMALTMVSPASMTREILELAEQSIGIRIRITSLNPVRPADAPDAWESSALRRFEAGVPELVELIPAEAPVHRYMAPLKVGKACLACHEKQGYQLGQVRGGISVTMPAAHLLDIRDAELLHSSVAHALALVAMLGLLHFLVAANRRHVTALKALAAEQEHVIVERTHALTNANRELQQRLADRELIAAVFDNTVEAIIVTDDCGIIVQVNPSFSRITGFAAGDVLGKAASLLKSGRHSRGSSSGMWRSLRRNGRWQGEVWNRHKNGQVYVVWLSIVQVAGAGRAVRYVATLADITQRKEVEEELRHQAYHDPLTDLPNRALFADRLRVALLQAQRHERSLALCFIDLDNFKPVNDSFGHAAGDDLLVEAARRMRLSVRAADTLARLGGDEFGALLTEVGSRAEVEEVATRIVADLARPFELKAGTAHISCSIGIALFPEHGRDVEALQHSADAALYEVKEASRNAYRIYFNHGPG